MDHDLDREAALARIQQEFADVPRPGDDEYAALSFLSAGGFRHFLPAYLRFVLRNDDLGQAAIGSTLASLDPGRFGAELEAFQRSKYVRFTEDERRAIRAFLDVMADHDEIGDAVAAWSSGV